MYKKVLNITLFLFLLAQFGIAQQKKITRPNIIFIIVDDQGYGDIGVFHQNQRASKGLPYERSPYLDKMASEGAILTHHYASAPVCAPSRASIMEGVSQGHASVRDNQFDKAIADNYTMASTLKRLGYSTAAIGKWGLQGDKRWDGEEGASWPAIPRNRGFDYFFGYMRHGDGHQHYPKEGKYTGKKEVWFNGKEISDKLDKCYTADLWTAAAKHWIINHEKGENRDSPFFMYLAYDTPHAVDELPTQKYPSGGGLQGGLQWIGEPGHFINTASGEIDSYYHPDYAQATYDDDNNPSTPDIPWPETYKRYAMANRRIDYAVGDVLKLLKDLHMDSTTLVVYTSDNGPSIETYLGKWQSDEEKQLPVFFESYGLFDGIKRDNWEGGLRMPTIARWPGNIPAGKIVKTPNISYDWAATLIHAAGSVAPERMDGVSLLPSLTGERKQNQSQIYIEYFEAGKTPGFGDFAPGHRDRRRRQMQNIRVGDYVGVRYDIKSSDDDFEIYNVVEDLGETNNLASDRRKRVKIKGDIPVRKNVFGKVSIYALEKYMKERVLQLRRPDASAPRPYDSALVSPLKTKAIQGVNWKFFKGNFPWIPQVAALEANMSGVSTELTLDGISPKTDGILVFYGYINVPQDGKYTFYLTADTKAFLRIHDVQLIDEDYGYQGNKEQEASILLKAGQHPFKIYYKMQDKEGRRLNIEWSGPGIEKGGIKKKSFFRD